MGEYLVERPKGKVLGYVAVVEHTTEVHLTGKQSPKYGSFVGHDNLLLASNYENLLFEAKNSGFAVACVGSVQEAKIGLLVALQRGSLWEVFVGSPNRLQRLVVDYKTSFDFGGGTFLTGRDADGQVASILIPDHSRDNLGLVPTFNGERVRPW